jgi:hypothetical protein
MAFGGKGPFIILILKPTQHVASHKRGSHLLVTDPNLRLKLRIHRRQQQNHQHAIIYFSSECPYNLLMDFPPSCIYKYGPLSEHNMWHPVGEIPISQR